SEVEQLLGYPTRYVGEDEVAHRLVGTAQAAGQHPQQQLGRLRTLGEPGLEGRVLQRRKLDVGDGSGRRGARAGVEERQLAEDVAWAEDRQQVLASVGGAAADLDFAGEDEEHPVAG